MIEGLSFRGGSVFTGDFNRPGDGGAIFNRGSLRLIDSTVSGNAADVGGGIGSSGTLSLTNSTVSQNFAGVFDGGAGGGGGISNSGTLTLTNSTVSRNLGQMVCGGGIFNSGTLSLIDSTVSGNRSDCGGGGIFSSGTLSLTNSTVSGNSAFEDIGGGIFSSGTLSLTNSTVSGNSADVGGGIGSSGTLSLTNSTVSQNFAAAFLSTRDNGGGILNFQGRTAELTHTIVAGNLEGLFTESPSDCGGGMSVSLGHNLVGADTGCPSDGLGDQLVDPAAVFTDVLGPLQDNGGPTETHNLLPGSPAIDAGLPVCTDANSVALTTDQRGSPRPVDGNSDSIVACDIGAVEFQP